MDNVQDDVEDVSEVKHRLIEAVLALVNGADNLPRHDLLGLWSRHGELISKIVDGAGLTNDQLHAITDTAEPGSFESIAHLAPLATQVRKLAVFHAAATIAVSLLKRAQLIARGPGTITGTPPPPRALVPIRAQVFEPQAPQPVADPPIAPVVHVAATVQPSDTPAPPVVAKKVVRDDPQITGSSRPAPQTIMSILMSDLPPEEKRLRSWNFAKRFGMVILFIVNVVALLVGAWHGMEYAGKQLGNTGSILGFVLALIALAVNGIPWWKYFEKEA